MASPLWVQAAEEAKRGIDLLSYGEVRCTDATRHLENAARLSARIYEEMCARHKDNGC